MKRKLPPPVQEKPTKPTKPGKVSKKSSLGKKRLVRKPATAKKTEGPGVSTCLLNPKQLRFVDEYLKDLNATQAAIRAKYSQRSAAEQAYDLLRKPQIQQAIAAKQKELAHKAGVTVERIVAEAARIAFSDVRKAFNADGNLIPIHELDDATAGAISAIEVSVTGTGDFVMNTKKIKLWDKNSALDKLLKHLGMAGSGETVDDRILALEKRDRGG